MISYGRQWIDKADIKAVTQVLESDWLTQGPKINKFEQKLARYCGAKYAVAVSSGTAALHLAYLVAGLRAGDEVICSPNTFVATTNMLLVVGAKPVFCDIRLDTYNLDEQKVEKLISKKTKAIVPVHFSGQPCEMNTILRIAKKHHLLVIEDAAHALGARYQGEKIGSLSSDMCIFSFHPVKSITTGEGGAVLTNNSRHYKKLLSLRSHGIHKNKLGKNVMADLGFNYRLTDFQSALGISQLRKLGRFLKDRHSVVQWYEQELNSLNQVILPRELPRNYSSWHLYVVRVKNPKLRDRLYKFLRRRGIGVNFHYPAVYSHPYYRRHGFAAFALPNTEIYQKSCLTLPCYPTLARSQIRYISRTIKSFFRSYERTA